MAEKAPAYQWYPKDFKSDEKCQLMNYEQQGVYRALLDHQWLHGSIPNEIEDIAELLKIPLKEFQKIWRRVGVCFKEIDGRLANERMEKDRAEREQFKAERSAAGSKGAEKRWMKDGSANGSAIEEPMAKHSSASASASASANTKNTSTQKDTNTHGVLSNADALFEAFAKEFPKRDGDSCKAAAKRKFVSKFKDHEFAKTCIDAAIRYRKFCDHKQITRTDKVCQITTWLNQQRWTEDYEILAPATSKQAEPDADRRKPKEGLDYVLIARNNEPARRFKLDRQTPFNEDDWKQERGLAA